MKFSRAQCIQRSKVDAPQKQRIADHAYCLSTHARPWPTGYKITPFSLDALLNAAHPGQPEARPHLEHKTDHSERSEQDFARAMKISGTSNPPNPTRTERRWF